MLDLFRHDLLVFARSHRFWLTFAGVVLVFAFTGPFGTAEKWGFAVRLGYWFTHQLGAWSTAILCVVIANRLLVRILPGVLSRLLAGAAFSVLPMALVISLIQSSWTAVTPGWAEIAENGLMSLPLTLIFAVITYLAMSAAPEAGQPLADPRTSHPPPAATRPEPDQAAMPAAPPPARPAAPILARLKPEQRGDLRALSVQDHYTMVTTSRGRAMILLRFSDALGECGDTPGLQVHRSHWVADSHVERLERSGDKLILLCRDGSRIPVSRSHQAAVRARFAGLD